MSQNDLNEWELLMKSCSKLRNQRLRTLIEIYDFSINFPIIDILGNIKAKRKGQVTAQVIADKFNMSLRTAKDYLRACRIIQQLSYMPGISCIYKKKKVT